MTEAQWLKATDVRSLLILQEARSSDRKARLFACGLGRRLLPYLGDERSRRIIDIAERNADGHASDYDLSVAREAALDVRRGTASRLVCAAGDHGAWQGARVFIVSLIQAGDQADARDWHAKLSKVALPIFRCVFGNPFRPVAFDPRWRTADTVGLARGIYEERAFDRLPLLADALMDAGCADEQVLEHCRTEGPHVRGCWVVDLVLGKE